MIIELDSYYITPIQKSDAWTICDFSVRNEDRLKPFFPQTLAQTATPDLAKIFANKKEKQFNDREEFLFTIKEKNTNELVGLVYIKELDWEKKQGEFAYAIDYRVEGKGITSKAINVLSNYAFKTLKLKTLQIIAHKTNIGSAKVAKNNNFNWIKTLVKEFTPPGGEPLDMELFELYYEK